MAQQPDVIVVGAGVMGCATAYWLSKEGYKVVVLEKEAIAVGASGMSAAMWPAAGRVAGVTLSDQVARLARLGFLLHQQVSRILPEEAGMEYGYCEGLSIQLAFTPEEAVDLKGQCSFLAASDPHIRWVEAVELRAIETRVSRAALGGVVSQQGQVLAYRFVLALAQAAERRGMELRSGAVVGIERDNGCVTGVRLRNGTTIHSGNVVLAMGPWSTEAGGWLGFNIPIYPVRGQILELRLPDPKLRTSLSYGHVYLVRKADGLTLAGTTEEPESGFDNRPTQAGMEFIMEGAIGLAPSLEEARIVNHLSGLRPGSVDGLPLIGAVPGWKGLYLLSGHFRKGMALSMISGRIIADLITGGETSENITSFDPARFAPGG